MAQIQGGLLNLLGNIYRLVGGVRGASELELSVPVQLVHDVSREAEFCSFELSNSGRGYFYITIPVTHGIADTQRGVKDIYVELDALTDAQVPTLEVWLIDVQAPDVAVAVGVTRMGAALVFPGDFPEAGTPPSLHPVKAWTSNIGTFSNSAASGSIQALISPVLQAPTPLFVPRGALLTYESVSGGAGTNLLAALFWAGPSGVRPPGVA